MSIENSREPIFFDQILIFLDKQKGFIPKKYELININSFPNQQICKAMKSNPLLGPFGDSEFLEFSLLKIWIGWEILCFKLQTIVSCALR